MSERKKIDPVLKVELVEKYLRDEIGIREAARQAGLSGSGTESFRKWIDIYQNEGPAGLLEQKSFKSYSLELKISAVNDYLEGTPPAGIGRNPDVLQAFFYEKIKFYIDVTSE